MIEMCTAGLVSALTTAQQNVAKQEPGSDTPGRSKFSADAWMQGVLLELLQRSWDLEVDSAFPELLCEQVASTSALVSAMQGESSLAELCPEALSDVQAYLTLLQAAGESPEVAATSVTSFRHEKLELDVGGYILVRPHLFYHLFGLASQIWPPLAWAFKMQDCEVIRERRPKRFTRVRPMLVSFRFEVSQGFAPW